MKKTLFGLAILTFACTFACAPKQGSIKARPARAGVAVQQFATKADMKKAVANWQVLCDSSADCPDYVAEMVTAIGKGARICTATLIAPDLVLTNSHCFDNKDLSPADACKTTKFVFADKSASGPDSVLCKEIVSKSTIIHGVFDKADYAVVRLDHPLTRQAAVVSRAGLQQHESLTLHKIDADPDPQKGNGTMHTDHCTVLEGTSFMPDASHDTDPVLITRDCDVLDGNSGSPLVDDKGQVAAIAFASVDHDAATLKKEADAGDTNDLAMAKAKMSHVTNLACLDLPAPVAPLSAACVAVAAAKAKAQKDGTYVEPASRVSPNLDVKGNWPAIQAAAVIAAQAHQDVLDTKFGYHAAVGKSLIVYIPYCFQTPESWLSQFLQGGALPTSGDVKTVKLTWRLDWSINEDLVAVPQLTESSAPTPQDIQFNPSALKTTGQSPLTIATGAQGRGKTCAPPAAQ